MNRLSLPKENKERQIALNRYLSRAQKERRIAAVEWWLSRHYLRGCRYFETIEYQTGRVRPVYGDETGSLPFRYEELVNIYITEIGRLERLDTRPSVRQVSAGLNDLKDKSTAQGILDGIYPFTNPKQVRAEFFEALTLLGCAGQYTYSDKEDVDKENPQANIRVSVIYPWNLLFLPANIGSPAEAEGIVRDQWVPVEWLKDQDNYPEITSIDESDEDYEIRYVKLGDQFDTQDNISKSETDNDPPPEKKDKTGVAIVHLYEIWSRFPNNRLRSYDVVVGKKLMHTEHYENSSDTPICPIDAACRGEGISPYGRSFIAPMIPLNAELEAMLANIFRQMQDFDMFGQVGIPVSWGVDINQLAAVGPGSSRYWSFDPDPARPNDKSEVIQPISNPQMLNSIASMGLGLLTRMAQQPEMLTQGDAPGRVDSEKGLNFLYQASTIPLGTIAASIERCYVSTYKKQLCLASDWDNFQVNLDSLLDDFALIGLKFDYQKGRVALDNNSVPDPTGVDITIRSAEPVDKNATEQKLWTTLQQGLVSPTQFRVEARLRGLDIPLPNDSEWQNYRMAVLRNLILFGDGLNPGILPENMSPSKYDNPEVHLMVIQRLMSSPEFALSSDEVQTEFGKILEMYQTAAGQYPDQLEYPEEAAMMQQGMSEPTGQPGAPDGIDMNELFSGPLSPDTPMIGA